MIERLRSVARSAKAAHGMRFAPRAGRAILSAGLAALAVTAVSSAAQAQYISPAARKPFAISIGTFIPSDDDVRKVGGTQNLAVGFDWIAQQIPERSAVSVLSLGYIERGGFKMIPATISYIIRETSTDLGKGYYYGIGGGLYLTRVAASDTSGENKWIPGGFVVVGLDLTEKFFGELKYHYVNKYDGKFVGGTQVSIGLRF